jgi:hypothetical protein
VSNYVFKTPEEPPIASIENSRTAQSLAAELQNPAAPGERHSQIKRTIIPMMEIGLSDGAIFSQYRRMYDGDLSDDEIEAFIKWGRAKTNGSAGVEYRKASAKKTKYTNQEKIENAIRFLNGFRIDAADLWEESQLKSENDSDAILYLSLFRPEDFVNLNTRYLFREQKDGSKKAELCGPGETHLASEWIGDIQTNGVPKGRAGVWIRINPLKAICGKSDSGAHTDDDVLRCDRLLLESDALPFDVGLSLLAKIQVPICAIVDSAGRGPHGIAALNAQNAVDYSLKVRAIFNFLEPFGIDPGNSNPSRYSRLPGAKRIIGARADASVQKLLYLAPQPRIGGIFP